MSIRLDIILLFVIPIAYFVPSLSWMASIALWGATVFMWGAVVIMLAKYQVFVELYRQHLKGVADHKLQDTIARLKFKPTFYLTYGIVGIGGWMIGSEFVTTMFLIGMLAFQLVLRDAVRDAKGS